MSIHIDDLDVLSSAYMPFLEHGGIFLPSAVIYRDEKRPATPYGLNDELCLLLQLFDEPEPHCCIVRVVWLTPVRLPGGQCAGLGLQFGRSDLQLRSLIESRLGDHRTDSTQTL